MPADDLQLLQDAAQQASEIALKYWKTAQQVDHKEGGSPVSEGDYAVDRFLRHELLAARPDYGWLSEETEDDLARLNTEAQFIVDPIDGTRAYVGGQDTWALSLAVVRGGRPVAGVVYLPVSQKLYAAAAGQGAWLNGRPIRAGDRADPTGAEVLAPKATLDPKWWAQTPPEVKRAFCPSLAYRFCLVAEGSRDALMTIRDAWEWDIAAGTLIAEEAGATVTDRHGAPLTFNRNPSLSAGVIAAGPKLHRELLTRYRGAAPRADTPAESPPPAD